MHSIHTPTGVTGVRSLARTAAPWLLFLAVGAGRASAQTVQFRHLRPDDGLAASWVRDIVQDRSGYMWFGTSRGLNRYDGYGFALYSHQRGDSASLPDNQINCLYEDRAGTLWVGTAAGLSRYDADRDRFVNHRIGATAAAGPSRPVVAMLDDRRGGFWIGLSEGCIGSTAARAPLPRTRGTRPRGWRTGRWRC